MKRTSDTSPPRADVKKAKSDIATGEAVQDAVDAKPTIPEEDWLQEIASPAIDSRLQGFYPRFISPLT
jgi:hypothetical protein